jgi:hypothetical protein
VIEGDLKLALLFTRKSWFRRNPGSQKRASPPLPIKKRFSLLVVISFAEMELPVKTFPRRAPVVLMAEGLVGLPF